MNRPRNGFTLIELLTVIVVIVILAGLVIYGVGHVNRLSRERSTRVLLENCRSMLTELETATGLAEVRAIYPPTQQIPTPGNVSEDGPDRHGDAVDHTHEVMTILAKVPANRNMLASLPPEHLMQDDDPSHNHQPVVLDAWGNPIIFVPGGGLTGVEIAGQLQYTSQNPLRSPDRRPFFASAGPDGDFSKGDDNLYSFEQ